MENADLITVAVLIPGPFFSMVHLSAAIVLSKKIVQNLETKLAACMSLPIHSLEGTRNTKKKKKAVTPEIRAVGKKPQAKTTADTGEASHP